MSPAANLSTGSNPNTSKGDLPSEAEERLCRIDNRIDNADLQERQAQLGTVIKDGLQRMDEKTTKYNIVGHKFVHQNQTV
jgi:hypothetical protein